jgi:hypothetical protein
VHRPLVAITLLLAMLAGCGEGYPVDPAQLNLDGNSDSLSGARSMLHDFLVRDGFEDLGKYEDMIGLLRQDTGMAASAKRELQDRLDREYTYLNERRHLRVVVTSYLDGVPSDVRLNYTPISNNFIELDIFDERPGGFSADGLDFYGRLVSALRQRYGAAIHEMHGPPPTNEAEFRRVSRTNAIANALAWTLVLAITFLGTGSLTYYMLRKLRLSALSKRLLFTVINAWLAAPLPFPAAFIMVIPAPNLFAFPWTSLDFYSRVAPIARDSFSVALVLCATTSLFLFRPKVYAERAGLPHEH